MRTPVIVGAGAAFWWLSAHPRGILGPMTTHRRRHLASSPFRPEPEPTLEEFALDDVVSHDTYGLGRVVQVQAGAVVVDFGSQTLRVVSPFHKMTRL